jgi:hypothetical protein
MISPNFMILAAILTVIGNGVYARAAYRGITKPNLMSWSLWSVIPLIMFFAQRSQGVGQQSYLSLIVGLTPLAIIIAAWFGTNLRYKIQKADLLCLGASLAAIILWLITGNSIIAIVLSILAGTYASMLTFMHGYHHPEQENALPFMCGVISAITTLLTTQKFDLQSTGFAVYLLLSNAALVFVIAVLPRVRNYQR